MPERLHPTIVMMPDASGNFMRHQHFAAGPPRTDVPEKEGVPILARFSNTTTVCTFSAGRFRAQNGYAWGTPSRWAYITWAPEDDTIYDSVGPYQPESKGLWLYDTMRLIAKFHKLVDVMAIIDRLEWGNPEEGVPEEN